ncbi:MAG TPA: coproporphyrinogen dehydrogenase HemZ [Candidatus Deferrimicrobium sp.]|nr:coproporphyrinogen dehydrogenase HemZ [Candidatus Deferrimicrobium sp.]
MGVQVFGPPELVRAIDNLLRIYFPTPAGSQVEIQLEQACVEGKSCVICKVGGQVVTEPIGDQPKRSAKVAFIKAMHALSPELRLPWGILTGIRPTKIVHRLLDQGYALEQIPACLEQQYLIEPEKVALVLQVANLQRGYLLTPQQARKSVSVYIGVPFCPSRCVYCSFPSVVGEKLHLEEYVSALGQEIAALGAFLKEYKLGVQTLYIGGGTPTILEESQLRELLTLCQTYLIDSDTQEITVEAGRPDTLDRGKLSLLRDMGVGRLSINPQTMVDKTLVKIGRKHTPEQILEAVELARKLGFNNINMDIILGLPGERLSDVLYTLEQLERLKPESLTVHALAVKRASALREEIGENQLLSGKEAEEMQAAAFQSAQSMGLVPYYLYRQKQILGNLENVGYAKPGKESVYNIQIMEERQSIFALGAGSTTKIVNPSDWSLVNIPNPKLPERYYERWQDLMTEKIRVFTEFNELA